MEEADGQLNNRQRLKAVEKHHGSREKPSQVRGPKQQWDDRKGVKTNDKRGGEG